MMEGTEREGKRMRARRGGSPAAKKVQQFIFLSPTLAEEYVRI